MKISNTFIIENFTLGLFITINTKIILYSSKPPFQIYHVSVISLEYYNTRAWIYYFLPVKCNHFVKTWYKQKQQPHFALRLSIAQKELVFWWLLRCNSTPWKSSPGFSVHLKQNVLEYSWCACCVSFWCTAVWFSYTYTYIHSF